MTTLTIELGARSYPIEIGHNLLAQANLFAPHLKVGRPVIVVTNETVAPLYLGSLTKTLSSLELPVHPIVLPDGEAYKTAESLMTIYDEMLRLNCDRKTPIIALGGGVIGDMAGFAAATYQRGVPFIQVPTTLLAQVDSSVGGKTGINHPLGKNMIGAFYQPRLVVADLDTLSTLDERDLFSGISEIIKYGLIADPPFFNWLEDHIEALVASDSAALDHAITQSCLNKKRIVDDDEFEAGQRALLNLGHTFGHAIETATGYGQWRHGEAVAVGMIMAADLSYRLGRLDRTSLDRTVSLITQARLPIMGPAVLSADDYLALMAHDKKNQDGRLRLILLDGIGKGVIVDDAPTTAIVETINARSE
jgi:3-dehydroquinate synthase